LHTPYHAIVFGIILIFGEDSFWQMCEGHDLINSGNKSSKEKEPTPAKIARVRRLKS
tara:strand:- start:125 stop:295 length:171 start_codon:yes stop_codon:yes gene_type:complete